MADSEVSNSGRSAMQENLNDLRTFLVVAREGSFTKAAAQLGVSQSALSHAVKTMEERLGIKLLVRTTRSVSTTQAGERLRQKLTPLFADIDHEMDNLRSVEDGQLHGSLRINATEHAFAVVLWERLQGFIRDNPQVSLELSCDIRFADIVSERFDMGVRLGDDVAKDMIAVRVSPDMRMCLAASPDYLKTCARLKTPHDLTEHECLALRLPTLGGVLEWEFADPKKCGKTVTFQPQGRLVFNVNSVMLRAALAGFGLIWAPRDALRAEIAAGNLVEVLGDWAMQYMGYHLYYPNRRNDSPLFQAMVAALRWRA